MSTYNNLHSSIHAKHAHVKVHHCISQSASSFAWVTPIFELYCVASPNANRNALAQSASKIVQWVQREEERLFIIGGAVGHPQEGFFFFWLILTSFQGFLKSELLRYSAENRGHLCATDTTLLST
jgi:hypothetical protein